MTVTVSKIFFSWISPNLSNIVALASLAISFHVYRKNKIFSSSVHTSNLNNLVSNSYSQYQEKRQAITVLNPSYISDSMEEDAVRAFEESKTSYLSILDECCAAYFNKHIDRKYFDIAHSSEVKSIFSSPDFQAALSDTEKFPFLRKFHSQLG